MPRVLRPLLATGAAAVAAVVWFGGVGSAARVATHATAAASQTHRSYKAHTTWVPLPSKGNATLGKGTFSAKLGPAAALLAYAYEGITGVPLPEIAEGGRFVLKENFGKNGLQTGTIVLVYKKGKLGKACASFTAHHVGSVNSEGFVSDVGSVRSTGGTGSAARWRVKLTFSLTGISGTSTEHLSYSGKAAASLGSAKKPSAACRALMRLLK